MKKSYADTGKIARARNLRLNSTNAEKNLWHALRDRQVLGYKFRRQHPIAGYYLDFACEDTMLAIELDGGQHSDAAQSHHDAQRTEKLKQLGWQILRFWNNDVLENFEGVLLVIQQALTRNHEK